VRAMGAGGVLKISLEQMGEDWQINFADTGPGMTRQLVEKIFEPFQSQFEGGTGLGLAIVYQIVQAHEGKVWARSKLGEGSVFVLRLRRAVVAESAMVQPGEAAPQVPSETGDKIAAAAGIGGYTHG
jgi:signal transduction histidine kinase